MACGIPQVMTFVWYLRTKAKGESDDDGILAPPNTAATTRDSRFAEPETDQSQHSPRLGHDSDSDRFQSELVGAKADDRGLRGPAGQESTASSPTVESQAPPRVPVLTSPTSPTRLDHGGGPIGSS